MDGRGRTAGTGDDEHLRDLIEQVLFTAPGERVMRPGFGSGLLGLVFEPNGPGQGAATRHLVEAALQRELGDRIAVQDLEVTVDEGTLSVSIAYVALRSQQFETVTLTGPGA